MKQVVYVLLFLLITSGLAAQGTFDLKGVVLDAAGKPKGNVELSVLYTKISTKSNKKGEFTLKKIMPSDTIRVVVDKEKAARFFVGNNKQVVVSIVDDVVNLTFGNGDSMASLLYVLPPEERGGNTNVITAQVIARNSFRSLDQAIQDMIPGVQVTRSNEGLKVNMRGMNSLTQQSETLVLVDGAETTFDDANNNVSIYDVDRIEVHKDGMGYGVKGSGGVIVIKTKGN